MHVPLDDYVDLVQYSQSLVPTVNVLYKLTVKFSESQKVSIVQ